MGWATSRDRDGRARSAHDQRGPGRGRHRGDSGVDACERDALESVEDGRADRAVEVHDREDLVRLRPQAAPGRSLKLSTDPLFIDKLYDVVGLYLNPPEAAVVLCVDEKSQSRPYSAPSRRCR